MPEFKEYFKEIMETAEQIIDNPTGWVGNHIRMYVESNGEKGHDWHGMRTLLLTTRGCKSGKLRRTALIYGEADGNYLIIASNGGADDHPLWYLNLSEQDKSPCPHARSRRQPNSTVAAGRHGCESTGGALNGLGSHHHDNTG